MTSGCCFGLVRYRAVLLLCLHGLASAQAPGDYSVTSRAVLPKLPPGCVVEVQYCEQKIKALGKIGEILSSFHSGLALKVMSCDFRPTTITLEYYALDFPFGALLPKVTDGQPPTWNNTAILAYRPGVKETKWDKVHYIGSMSSDVFNSWCEYLGDYTKANGGYQLWDVWSEPTLTSTNKIWFSDTICTSFSQAALVAAYKAGAKFENSAQMVFNRNYQPFITHTEPKVVDLSDSAQLAEVNRYWKLLSDVAHQDTNMTEFQATLAGLPKPFAFVYDPPNMRYFKVDLAPPYVNLRYDPMTFPWQKAAQVYV